MSKPEELHAEQLQASVGRVVTFDAGTRRQREEQIDKLKGDVARLRGEAEKEEREAIVAREKATKAKEEAVRAESAAIKEEGEAKAARARLDAKIAELARVQGTAPAQPAPQPPKKK